MPFITRESFHACVVLELNQRNMITSQRNWLPNNYLKQNIFGYWKETERENVYKEN